MLNNAKLVRWLAPVCLFLLLLILILAVVFTSSPGTIDANTLEATVISQLHQTATAEAKPHTPVKPTQPPIQTTQVPVHPTTPTTPTVKGTATP